MLLVFGAINIDFVFPVPALPRAGDTVWSEGGHIGASGKGANQAVAAARDGARVELVGAVGRDVLADGALTRLRRAGVGLRGGARCDEPTGRAAISVAPDGRTMITVSAGANRRARAAQVSDVQLGPRTTLLLQMETENAENARLIARARARGARIILNLSPRRPIGAASLRAVDLLIGNSAELAWCGEHLGSGNNPASLHAALGVATVRMMGPQGAEAMSDAGFLHMPAPPVAMHDTTAAADSFVGVLAAGLARGQALDASIRRASVAAALSVREVGAQSSLPSASEIDAALVRAPYPGRVQAKVQD